MTLYQRAKAWLRAAFTGHDGRCTTHHWHPDRTGWFCCWSRHSLPHGNTPPPTHTTLLCQLEPPDDPDAIETWLSGVRSHRAPARAGRRAAS